MRSNRSRLIFVIGSIAALASIRAVTTPSSSGRDPATRALAIFSDVLNLTRQNYVEPVDSKTLLQGAYDGMSEALDPFSYYVAAADRAAYRAEQNSAAVGPGIVVARRGGLPYVVAALPGSPAETAGVKSGDLIDMVDGKQVRNSPLWKIKGALEGPEGTHVALVVFRGGEEKRLTLNVARSGFEPPRPTTKWEKDVAIVRVPAFTHETPAALRQVVEEAGKRSISRMIIDVRGTIGGEISDAAPAASIFTGKGLVARVLARRISIAPLEATGERLWTGRTVVLTDDATGGPAEVFAAALHDRAGATTVGETTVGLAIVQRLVPTESGGTLYMTVGKYLSPSGTPIGGKGLTPDERVMVFPGESDAKDAILTRGLEVVREAGPARQAA